MKPKSIICSVPEKHKAQAIKNFLENDISQNYPASIFKNHQSDI